MKTVFDWPGGRAGFDAICRRESKLFESPHAVPNDVKKSVDCSIIPFAGCHTHIMRTKGGTSIDGNSEEITIVFYHGGAYVLNIWDSHLRGCSALVKELSKSRRCQVIIPEYPTTAVPGVTYKEMIDLAVEVYRQAAASVPGPVVLMGDSAGGGLALLVAQRLTEAGKEGSKVKQPSSLLLLSPWLDVTVSDPRSASLESYDCFLKRSFLQEAGRAFSGGLSAEDPRVSPLFGPLQALPPISIWTSAHDMLLPDSLRLRERMEKEEPEHKVRFVKEAGLLHDWWMWGQAEGDRTIRQLAEAIQSDGVFD